MATLDDNIATQVVRDEENEAEQFRHVEENGHMNKSRRVEDKGYSKTSVTSNMSSEVVLDEKSTWSQNQQKMFEKALATVPKDVPDRWVQIARNVPGKTKVSIFHFTIMTLT